MLVRQAGRAGLRAWAGASRARALATQAPTGDDLPEEFKNAWKTVAPNLELPRFPVSYMKPRPELQTTIPSKLTINLVVPHKIEIQAKEVDMVIIPATTGQLGVLPSHVPTIAELKPGVLSIHEGDDVQKYFVSSGFAFVHQNSVCDVVVLESVTMDQLDAEEIRKGLAEYTEKFNSASTDLEKAEAQIGVEVHSALSTALTQ